MRPPTPDVGTPERVSPTPGRLTREQVVDRIISMNRTVGPGFLEEFSDEELELYLRRLTAMHEPRGRRAVWVRRGDAPGIVGRRHRA